MSQFLYNHTKYRCDQKLKIYDPNDRSLAGLYNRNLKQAKPLYIKSNYKEPGFYNVGKSNQKKMNDILNKYMNDYEKIKTNKEFDKRSENEIDDETLEKITKKINKLFYSKNDIYDDDDLINPDCLLDQFEDEKNSNKKSLLINKNTEKDYENRKNDNFDKNKNIEDSIYDKNNKNIVKDGEDLEEVFNNFADFDIDKVKTIQKNYRNYKLIKPNLKNYYTHFDGTGEYVNFIYLDKNELKNNYIENLYFKIYSCKKQKHFQQKFNINQLHKMGVIDNNKELTEDYVKENKKKIANIIFKDYCNKNKIIFKSVKEDDSIEDEYKFDNEFKESNFNQLIKDNEIKEDSIDDNLKSSKNNKVIEVHEEKDSENYYIENEEVQEKPVDERENENKKEKENEKEKESEEYYFDNEEVQDKPVDERENNNNNNNNNNNENEYEIEEKIIEKINLN